MGKDPFVDMKNSQRNKTFKFLRQFLNWLPTESLSEDVYRTNAVFFTLSALCFVCDSLDGLVPSDDLLRWIHNNIVQVDSEKHGSLLGFNGGTCFPALCKDLQLLNSPHLTMTHLSIMSILMLAKEDDVGFSIFKELWSKRASIGASLRSCQKEDGSFCAELTSEDQADVRFVYSACCICNCFDLWHYVDQSKMYNFIVSCFNYDGGFGFVPASESHGASTFLALSSLKLAGLLDKFLDDDRKRKLVRWCILRQTKQGGLAGRPNKEADSCYTFWVGGSLQMLGCSSMIDARSCYNYVMSCVDQVDGGISKWPLHPADPLHTFSSLAGLYILAQFGQTDDRLLTVVPTGTNGLLRSKFHFHWCCNQQVLDRMLCYKTRISIEEKD